MRIAFLAAIGVALTALAQSPDPNTELTRARQLIAAGQPLEAAQVYEALLQRAPDDISLQVNLAVAYFKATRYEEVIRVCREAVRHNPGAAAAWMFLGAGYFQLHRPAEAVDPLRRAVDLQPTERNSRLMLGEALMLTGREADAVPHLEAAAQLLPGSPRVWYALERSWSALAKREAEAVDAAEEGSPIWFALAGDAALDRERYGLALHNYAECLRRRPGLAGVFEAMAEAYASARRPELAAEARRRHQQVVTSCPAASNALCALVRHDDQLAIQLSGTATDADSRYVRAKAYRHLAASAFERLARLPASSQWHELKARRLDDLGRHREAVAEWRAALEMAPDNPVLEQGLAWSLMNTQDNAAAAPLLARLATAAPQSTEVLVLQGQNHLALEQPLDAVREFRRALALQPGLSSAEAGLGQALLRAGKAEEAVSHLEASLRDDPDGTRHYQAAQAYRALARKDDVQRMLGVYRERQAVMEQRRQELDREYPIPPADVMVR